MDREVAQVVVVVRREGEQAVVAVDDLDHHLGVVEHQRPAREHVVVGEREAVGGEHVREADEVGGPLEVAQRGRVVGTGRAPGAPHVIVVEAVLDRPPGELDAVVHLELAQGVLHVVLHGAVGDDEALGDLLVGHALGDHLEDLGLAVGELVARVVGRALGHPAELPQHQAREAGREDGVAGGHAAYGVEQLLARRALDEVAGGARP